MLKATLRLAAVLGLSLSAHAGQRTFIDAAAGPRGQDQSAAEPPARPLADGLLLADALKPGDQITMNLAADFAPTLSIGAIELGGAGSRVVRGDLSGGPVAATGEGGAILAIKGNNLAGWVWTADRQFELRSIDGATVQIIESDVQTFDACATGEAHAVRPQNGATPPNEDPTDIETGQEVPEIDVLVVYTQAAENGAGGPTAMATFLDLAIAQTNDAYNRSLVPARLNLVHHARTTYDETGNASNDLSRLRTIGDGFADDAHTLREEYGADMVAMIVEQMSSACGIGYLMTFRSVEFASSAFTVTRRSCAVSNITFAHELGHNMGCQHDRQNAGTGIYPYAYGYRNPSATFRTVMAYAPGTRIPNFSNPSVLFNGEPTGVPAKSPTAAYNALTIANTAPTVATFRANQVADCNSNSIPDIQDLQSGASQDCNANNRPDECDVAGGAADCDADLIPDACELALNPGLDCNGNGILDSCDLAAGLLIDCNNNGDPDACEIAARRATDCNQNGIPDDCELSASGADCNNNQRPDDCDVQPLYRASSPQLSPIGAGAAVEFVFNGVRPALGDVTLTFELRGDFNTSAEYVDVSLNGAPIARLLETGGLDCASPGQSVSVVVAAQAFNQLLGGAQTLTLSGVASAGVNPTLCSPLNSYLAVAIEYDAQPLSADANQNGTPDECEVGLAGDMNCDGFVTVSDIGGFVLALTDAPAYAVQFPTCNIQHADTNNDSFVSVADIASFVALLTR
ncbi:MAG: M12 family metallo-peptidase [Phycisphaerae bacterium]|nr:M12 family metallo-peptidase [Phycisphaerae bacterium]